MMLSVAFLVLIIILLNYIGNKQFNYWNNKNIVCVKPKSFFISLFKSFVYNKTVTEISIDIYKKYPNEKLIGSYMGVYPCLIVKDRLLIKLISVTDFDSFSKRINTIDESQKLLKNIFQGDGDTFKLLKKALSPAFTISKLKNMFPLIINCTDKLQTLCDKIVQRGGIVNGHDIMSRFTIDFISSCGMGLDFGLVEENSQSFYEFATSLFHLSTLKSFAINLQSHLKFLPHIMKTQFNSVKKIQKFKALVKNVCDSRNYRPSGRHDFIDLLLEISLMGKLRRDSIDKKNPDGTPAQVEIDLSDPELFAAQVYVFFAAGFETSATTTSFSLHQLALHPEIQVRVHNEIDQVLSKYNNRLCFDAIREMNLLEMVFLESMRMFPPGGVIARVCTRRYTIPGTTITIDPGVSIVIPAAAMHMDERFFENPHQFQPERFSPGYKERLGDMYMPFGVGRRMCIGSHLGQMQSLAGLAAVLQRFTVDVAPTTSKHLKANRKIFYIHKTESGLPIKLVPRNLQL